MRVENRKIYSLVLRYLILIFLGIFLGIFYFIFTPLTVLPVYHLLNLFFSPSLSGPTIVFNGQAIQIGAACVAGSAYYLLAILNLSTPLKLKKRIYSLFFLFLTFLLINVLRIFSFSLLLVNSFSLFNTLHMITWYLLSGVIVFLIWVVNIKVFTIEKIPFYSDFKFLLGLSKK